MRSEMIVGAVAVLALAAASHAAVWSDGTFSTPVSQASFTAGTDPVGTYYTNTLNGKAYVDAADGNPGADLRLDQFGSTAALALTAPAAAANWTISFDYRRPNTWDTPRFQVYAFHDGDAADLNSAEYGGDMSVTGGSELLATTLPATQTTWAAQSFDVPVPAGFDVVMLRIASDGSAENVRIDNVLVTSSAVPEPASLGLLALGAAGLLRRRH